MHTLGLALAIQYDDETGLCTGKAVILKTSDTEGFVFGKESFEDENSDKSMLDNFLSSNNIREKIEKRKEILGFIEQE